MRGTSIVLMSLMVLAGRSLALAKDEAENKYRETDRSRAEYRMNIAVVDDFRPPKRITTAGLYKSYLDCLAALGVPNQVAGSDLFLIPNVNPDGYYVLHPARSQFYNQEKLDAKKCFHDYGTYSRVYYFKMFEGKREYISHVSFKGVQNGKLEGIVSEEMTSPYYTSEASPRKEPCLLQGGPTTSEGAAKEMLAKEVLAQVQNMKSRYERAREAVKSSAPALGGSAMDRPILPNPLNYIESLKVCRGIDDASAEKIKSAIDIQMKFFDTQVPVGKSGGNAEEMPVLQ